MKTAVIYARYSSASQTEQSIEGQLDVCKKYAQDNDLQIVDTYIDRAMTGKNDQRVAFQKLLSDSEKPVTWEIVLVYAIDRFGRNSIEIAVNKQRLKKNRKTLISATQRTSENIDGTKNLDGILLENMYIGLAEYYSEELSQKILRGLNESRKKGFYCGGGVPYGYKVVDRKIVEDTEKADTVRYIFSQYALGVYVPTIIKALTERGVYHKGKPFAPNTVYHILKNEKYLGIYRNKGEEYDNIYPQIVPIEIFDKVRKKAQKNKYGKRSVQVTYLLRHKLKCGYCGHPISAESGTSSNGEVIHYYKCHGRKKYRNGCEKTALRKEFLENFVLENILRELTKPDTMNKVVDGLMQIQELQNKESPILKTLLSEKRQTETALNNLMSAIEQGIISATTNKRLHELENKLTELERNILIEQSKTKITLSEDKIRKYYEQALLKEPQMLINLLIKQIVLYNDKMIVYYNSPIQTSPDGNSQGFSFYDEIAFMPYIIQNKPNPAMRAIRVIMTV